MARGRGTQNQPVWTPVHQPQASQNPRATRRCPKWSKSSAKEFDLDKDSLSDDVQETQPGYDTISSLPSPLSVDLTVESSDMPTRVASPMLLAPSLKVTSQHCAQDIPFFFECSSKVSGTPTIYKICKCITMIHSQLQPY